LENALKRANELEAKYGERFKAPQKLKDQVSHGKID